MTLEEQLAPTVRVPATLPAPAPKVCGCGRSHDAFEWDQLRLVAASWEGLCLRDCACGSTLAVALCSVPGCGLRSLYTTDGGEELCGGHELEFHMGEDREYVGDEWVCEERREYASAAE